MYRFDISASSFDGQRGDLETDGGREARRELILDPRAITGNKITHQARVEDERRRRGKVLRTYQCVKSEAMMLRTIHHIVRKLVLIWPDVPWCSNEVCGVSLQLLSRMTPRN